MTAEDSVRRVERNSLLERGNGELGTVCVFVELAQVSQASMESGFSSVARNERTLGVVESAQFQIHQRHFAVEKVAVRL